MSNMAERVIGAAQRRRERQLRAFPRHVQLAVAHHGAQPVGRVVDGPSEEQVHEMNEALRRQKRPPPGEWPAAKKEPQPLGFWPGAPRQLGHEVPSLAPPSLAAAMADGMGASTLAFLTRAALEERRKAEVERQAFKREEAKYLR